MPERVTQDLDLVILERDSAEAHKRLEDAGYTLDARLAIGGSRWLSPQGVLVDIIEGRENWWAQALDESAGNRDLQGLPVLPLPYLTLMKLQASRVQDVADVTRMLGQASDASLDQVRDVIAKYRPDLSEDLESLILLGKLELQEPS
jgi:hypothetical protein